MKKSFRSLMSIVLLLSLVSCAIVSPSATSKRLRTIVIDEKSFTEKERGDFISWRCGDYNKREIGVVEVGFVNAPEIKNVEFVLFDGGNSGEFTRYHREGLDHRWDWGDDYVYSFTSVRLRIP